MLGCSEDPLNKLERRIWLVESNILVGLGEFLLRIWRPNQRHAYFLF